MKRLHHWTLALACAILWPLTSAAQLDPCMPAKPGDQDHLVFQFTTFLSKDEAAQLDDKLVQFARETSNQIVVVVVPDLCGQDPAQYAQMLGEGWGLGKKGVDNGVMVLVKPTGDPGDRKVFIATGYGLEGAIPDATCKEIVENEIIPRFKDGDAYGGLDAGTNVLMQLARGEINAKSYGQEPFPWQALLVPLIIIVVILMKRNQVKRYARTNNIGFWAAWALLNQASRRHGGSWGGFSGGGGGGWSGGGGGGFGGFGGGSFGGGGAGGSW